MEEILDNLNKNNAKDSILKIKNTYNYSIEEQTDNYIILINDKNKKIKIKICLKK